MNPHQCLLFFLLSCLKGKNDAYATFRSASVKESRYNCRQTFSICSYSINFVRGQSRGRVTNALTSEKASESETPTSTMADAKWAKHALLISSFSEGVEKSSEARKILKNIVLGTVASEWVREKEESLRQSAINSPCCGPDIELLNDIEEFEAQMSESDTRGFAEMVEKITFERGITSMNIRMVYIPTAMYALRQESKNSPGKQRQRARADGKKRRSAIIKQLSVLLESFNILAITLDLDDASLKQSYGSDDMSLFPVNGKEALNKWAPHIIYVEGGNTFWLQHCVEKGNWGPLLINACTGIEAAVYIGNSAGAIIAGKLVETASWKGRDNPAVVEGRKLHNDWKGVLGLRMLGNISIFPHMSDEWFDVIYSKKNKAEYVDVMTLRDDQIICVDGTSKNITLVDAD